MKSNLIVSRLDSLKKLSAALASAPAASDKIKILEAVAAFQNFLSTGGLVRELYSTGSEKTKLVIGSILAIGEGPTVFRGIDPALHHWEQLCEILWNVELFYTDIGGIAGYHYTVLSLLQHQNEIPGNKHPERYLKPVCTDLTTPGNLLNRYVRRGIEQLHMMAEIYPVGGAGDRLDLRDQKTGDPLPAAALKFSGRTLLTLLVRDLQAKEYLHYKLLGRQITTPIAMMTSKEKSNDQHIRDICSRNNWYGRGEENFILMTQPLVPVITIEGHWSMGGPLELNLKPGGHGVIWKLARDLKVFDWLAKRGRKKALVRQINNPVAGTDNGVLAFCGLGCEDDKSFGFASCPRMLNTAQGVVVLREKKVDDEYRYTFSNIEYTEFRRRGINDKPEKPGGRYSKFPANTNILFVDLKAMEDAVNACPLPGVLVNFKTSIASIDQHGNVKKIKAGRLESTMQSISDCIIKRGSYPLTDDELREAKAYVTYNTTRKTISVTKQSWKPDGSLLETPEGCFYEVLQNNYELFRNQCGFVMPDFSDIDEYIKNGPNLLITYHPALGPLYSVISQKIRGGKLHAGSEVQLEIAEVDIENLELAGSLMIESTHPLGDINPQHGLTYSEQSGKCQLKNVIVTNEGIDRHKENTYWNARIQRNESLYIKLEGNGEFFAENVTFKGSRTFVVPAGWRWTAAQKKGHVIILKEKISEPTWCWKYAFKENDEVLLST